jgi:hypothetical protein
METANDTAIACFSDVARQGDLDGQGGNQNNPNGAGFSDVRGTLGSVRERTRGYAVSTPPLRAGRSHSSTAARTGPPLLPMVKFDGNL